MRYPSTMVALVVATLILPPGCSKDEGPTNTGGGGATGITSTAFPGNTANLAPGGAPAVGKLTGGTAPYTIKTAPNDTVATAAISGANYDTLTITPNEVGTDSVVIEDNSATSGDSPAKLSVTIIINVAKTTGGGIQGSGVFTLNTSLGNFSAEGLWVENATSGQGVGGFRTTNASEDFLQVTAYVVHSATNVDVMSAAYVFSGGTLIPGTYSFSFTGQQMYGILLVAFGIDPNNQNPDYYTATSGDALLNTINTSSASGTCSGSGIRYQNPSQTFTFDSKSFTVNGYGNGSPLEKAVQAAATRMLRKEIEARKTN